MTSKCFYINMTNIFIMHISLKPLRQLLITHFLPPLSLSKYQTKPNRFQVAVECNARCTVSVPVWHLPVEYQKNEYAEGGKKKKLHPPLPCVQDAPTEQSNLRRLMLNPACVSVCFFFFLEQSVGLPTTWLLRCSTDRATARSPTSGPSAVSCES